MVSTDPLETAKTVATNASPQLGNSWRYSVGVHRGAACQGGAYSAAVAARLCATDLPTTWTGCNSRPAPLLRCCPLAAPRPTSPHQARMWHSEAITYSRSGASTGSSRSTAARPPGRRATPSGGDWSFGRTFDAVRFGMRAFLNRRFKGRVPSGEAARSGYEWFLARGRRGRHRRVPRQHRRDHLRWRSRPQAVHRRGAVSDGCGIPADLFSRAAPRELHIISGVVAAAA